MSEPTTEDDNTLKNVVFAFIQLIPNPTDDQTHALAGLLGFNFLEFEDRMREVLIPYLEEDQDHNLPLDEDIELDIETELDTPLETFLLAFYLLKPEPTEEQLLILSVLVNLTVEELEEQTYKVINRLMESEPKFTDDSDLSDLYLDDDFDEDDTIEHDQDVSDDKPLTDTDGNSIQLF